MQARYRTDYAGEFVITETKWSGGKKEQTREWIENPIENQHLSHRAACIGSSVNRDQFFNYQILQRHRGGLLSSKKLQTYGTGEIAHEMRLDFAVELNAEKLEILKEQKYDETNILYTSARNCLANPGCFYLIPHTPHFQTEVTPVYLAAFDGHEEIFLLGYTNDTPLEGTRWINELSEIMSAYSSTQFFIVGEKTNLPTKFFDSSNVQKMSYREFIGYCDV